jgi:alpha-glucosidase
VLAGPLDYTPGIFDLLFDEYKKEERVHSTIAKELALFVVLYSPLQMAADLPENYDSNPAFQFIEDVPVNWDETLVLNGEIGDYVSIARRAEDEWYIGSITDENDRTLEIPLDFLDEDKKYMATVYADGLMADWETEPLDIEIRGFTVTAEDVLEVKLASGGGQAIRIIPKD